MSGRSVLGAGLLALCGGCGAGNSLEGSLSQELALGFDDVEVRYSAGALALSYLRLSGPAPGTTFQLLVRMDSPEAVAPGSVDLASRLSTGEPRAAASRAMGDEDSRFPPVAAGVIRLDAWRGKDGLTRGSFGLSFANEAATRYVGAGRSVHGTFAVEGSAEVESH
ncbi:MAG: hypothetical protein HYZ28_23005 [Myxococcales bacterium]|nr:hypothetical protein [Myxococcales bacterium]